MNKEELLKIMEDDKIEHSKLSNEDKQKLVNKWMPCLKIELSEMNGIPFIKIKEEEYEQAAEVLEKTVDDAKRAGYDHNGISQVICSVLRHFRDSKGFIIG